MKMKEVDFLFVYEVKARELENICLLKYELERSGYSVAFINTWYYLTRKVPRYKAKVVVAFGLYNDDTYRFICSFVNKFDKLINMQWEQVGTLSDEVSEKSQFLIKGLARNAVHICWGAKTKERLLKKCEIDEKKLKLTGHITLDFFRDSLVDYYKTRDEIFRKYDINSQNKKVCLFVSSFSYVNLPDNIIDNTPDLGYDFKHFIEISNDSQEEVIKWITLILSNREDIIFIYRPHPAEAENGKLVELTRKFKNFCVISELSVKQWILVCDVVYTWYSTSLAEIFRSGKKCHILRPIQIPRDIDLAICEDATFISDYSAFESSLMDKKNVFPIKDDKILEYYYFDENEPAYKKVCNSFIDVYKDDYYLLPKLNKNQKTPFLEKLKTSAYRSFINDALTYFSLNTNWSFSVIEKRRQSTNNGYSLYRDKQALINYASDEEIDIIVNRIKNVLDNT